MLKTRDIWIQWFGGSEIIPRKLIWNHQTPPPLSATARAPEASSPDIPSVLEDFGKEEMKSVLWGSDSKTHEFVRIPLTIQIRVESADDRSCHDRPGRIQQP